MNIELPLSTVLILLIILIIGLLLLGYQLDNMNQRIKELEMDEHKACHVEARMQSCFNMIRDEILNLNECQAVLSKSLMKLREKIESKCKRSPTKRGRPRKKVVDGHNS
jgi:hypothetical protein